MNYFDHHIGDYDQATAHLTAAEDGIYHRLLRKYYATEKPLPADMPTLQRLVRARTKEEKQAAEDVLKEFFTLEADGWHQARCDTEINEYHEKQVGRETEKLNAKERQRRARERRSFLFEQLRGHGLVPAYKTTTADLETMLSRVTQPIVTPTVTGDDTAIHTPVTSNHTPLTSSSSLSEQAAAAANTGGGSETSELLLLRPSAIAEKLKNLEAVRFDSTDPLIFAWAIASITDAQLEAAHARALERRKKDQSTLPVNTGLLDKMLGDLTRPVESGVTAKPIDDPEVIRRNELIAKYAGSKMLAESGVVLEVMSNGLVFVNADEPTQTGGALNGEQTVRFWADVEAGRVLPATAEVE